MSQKRTPESLTLADLPGADPARFDEWKRLNGRARRAVLFSPLVYLTGLITVPGIGGGIGWLLPIIFWFIYMFAYARPIASAERALATELGVPAALGLPTAGGSTKTKRVLKVVLYVWLGGIVLSLIMLAVQSLRPKQDTVTVGVDGVGAVTMPSGQSLAEPYAVTVLDLPTEYRGAHVQPEFFAAQGATPQAGRFFLPADYEPAATPSVVISHAFWMQMSQGSPAVLGVPIKLNGRDLVIIGVTAEGFRLPDNTDFWTPAVPTAKR